MKIIFSFNLLKTNDEIRRTFGNDFSIVKKWSLVCRDLVTRFFSDIFARLTITTKNYAILHSLLKFQKVLYDKKN